MPAVRIPVEDYLKTSYRPDVDYVDGYTEQRHCAGKTHGKMLLRLAILLNNMPAVFAYLETRTQVAPDRFRVPDVCAFLDREPDEERFTTPPYLCIEVLSPEDRIPRALKVAKDYFRMGVPNVWIVDPADRIAYVCGPDNTLHPAEFMIATSDGRIALPTEAIFA